MNGRTRRNAIRLQSKDPRYQWDNCQKVDAVVNSDYLKVILTIKLIKGIKGIGRHSERNN